MLPTWNFAWVYHSDAQESLLEFIRTKEGKLPWDRFNQLGIGYWLELSKLKQYIFKMANDTYKISKNVSDVMVWFLVSFFVLFLKGYCI